MKKLISIILCLTLCLSLFCGCDIKSEIAKRGLMNPAQSEADTEPDNIPSGGELSEPPLDNYSEMPEPPETPMDNFGEIHDPPETPVDGFGEVPEDADISDNSHLENTGRVIVLDPGHGKSSLLMSQQEKIDSGYTYVEGKGWGEWRHFKSGTMWQDCNGSGCSGRAPKNGGCWYSIGAGDRDIEPDLNYNNAINAKKYLEQKGYTVRLTRGQNDNPSITERIKKCYPGGNTSLEPDVLAYVCIHSNAGGGKGSCYISLSGLYDQSGIPQNYIGISNSLGETINNCITSSTSISKYGNGIYTGYPELVLFCKSPVPVAYLEIGFFDNPSDLNILRSESDGIGKAIAEGIDMYYN